LSEASHRVPVTELNRLIKENRVKDYPSPNLELGMRPLAFGTGTSRWLWERQPLAALNPFGIIQGGYITVLLDEMLSTAIASVLEDGESAVTIEIKVNFLRALFPGVCNGEARVIRRSRSLAFLEAHINAADENLAVTATSTWSITRR
jgi:uncharacterized protein (TIGR00369 family)